MLPARNPLNAMNRGLKSKRVEKQMVMQTLIKRGLLITEKVDCRIKKLARDKEGHYKDKRVNSLRNGKPIELQNT